MDEGLARHIAHMFIRDPLQVFRERIEQDDSKSSEHFETIQSSNWMNMRFKPPPPVRYAKEISSPLEALLHIKQLGLRMRLKLVGEWNSDRLKCS